MQKIAFYTLGCKLNFAETSSIAAKFKEEGFEIVSPNSFADIYVIHTCSVTATAEKKSRQAIRQARKKNPKAIIAVIGCYAELRGKEIYNLECADIILGNSDKYDLFEFIKNNEKLVKVGDIDKEKKFKIALSLEGRTRSFLKIQDGCDYFCSYCTIPYARGRSRSAKIDDIIKMIELSANKGVKEIVLTGINIGDFGKNNSQSLLELLYSVEEIKLIKRVRISSIEPDLLDSEIIKLISKSQVLMPHFHIALQSGSDKVLKAMNRKYNAQLFKGKVLEIKELIPYAFIAADVISGFPGESDEDFLKTKIFLEELPLSDLHVFTYSEREGTKAINFGNKVQNYIRKKRTNVLLKLSEIKKQEFYKLNLNTEQEVLWESNNYNGFIYAYTSNYLKVKTKFNIEKINTIEKIKLLKLNEKLEFEHH